MSLLNLNSDGLPNILVALIAAMQRSRKPLARDDLLSRIAPTGVVHKNGEMARQTFNRWSELGLFVEDGANTFRLAESLEETPANNEAEFLCAVQDMVRRRVLSEENNADFWALKGAKAADLTRSLAWVLAQDVYRFSFDKSAEVLEAAQLADDDVRLMRNDTRRNGLKFWGYFLGFLRQPSGGEIDPTCAIRQSLSRCIAAGEGMLATDFVRNLAAELPVLDGGKWRLNVEARLDRQALPALAEGQLSTSLSRALIQLRMEGLLILENRADAGTSIALTGHDGIRADYRYSWVRYGEPSRTKKA